MATTSKSLPLGALMPPVTLVNCAAVDGQSVTVTPGAKGTLVMFICNHCPYVVHIRAALVRMAHEAVDAGFAVVAINSNSVESHPQDGPEHMRALAKSEGWRFPFLFDASQDVARAFAAACTPELYLFDEKSALIYHGQFDDSRPNSGKPVTGKSLRAALDAAIAGSAPLDAQQASIGCGIKWKSR